jgi:hypothetical protein
MSHPLRQPTCKRKINTATAFIRIATLALGTMSGNAWPVSCLNEEHEQCDTLAHNELRVCDEQWDIDRAECQYHADAAINLGYSETAVENHLIFCRTSARASADACHHRAEQGRRSCKETAMDWCAS